MSRKIMLLAAIVDVVLSAAAAALAASWSGNNSAKGSSAKGNFANNKNFAGLVDIGGGRKNSRKKRGHNALGSKNQGQCIKAANHAQR